MNGAHIEMTHVNTIQERCCVDAFLSWINKHHFRAQNALLSPATTAERFNPERSGTLFKKIRGTFVDESTRTAIFFPATNGDKIPSDVHSGTF